MGKKVTPFIFLNEADQRLLKAIWYLKLKKWIIIFAMILGCAFGIFYSSIKKPLYTANLTFTTEDDNNIGGNNLLGLASQFGFNLGGSGLTGAFAGDNIIELFKSRRIIEQTLMLPYNGTRQSFADKYLDVTGWRSREDYPAVMFSINAGTSFTRLQDSLMGAMHKFIAEAVLNVERKDSKLSIYSISFKSNDETFSKLFTEELAEEVKTFYIDTKTKKAKETVDILQSKVDSIYKSYANALYGRAALADANLNPAFQIPLVGTQKKQTDITVLGTAYGELLKNLELAKFTLLKSTPLMQIIDVPHYPLEKKTYPYVLYVPLGIIGFMFLAIGWIIAYKIISEIYKRYLSASV